MFKSHYLWYNIKKIYKIKVCKDKIEKKNTTWLPITKEITSYFI